MDDGSFLAMKGLQATWKYSLLPTLRYVVRSIKKTQIGLQSSKLPKIGIWRGNPIYSWIEEPCFTEKPPCTLRDWLSLIRRGLTESTSIIGHLRDLRNGIGKGQAEGLHPTLRC